MTHRQMPLPIHQQLARPADEIAAMIRERLATAMEEMDALGALLEGEEVEV